MNPGPSCRTWHAAASVAFLVAWAALLAGRAAATDYEAIERHLHSASTYYRLGMVEMGNLDAFSAGLSHLDEAEALLPTTGGAEVDSAGRYSARIRALRTDILEQYDVSHDTFYGIFPLARLLHTTVLADAAAAGTFEFVDDPRSVAASLGARRLADQLVTYLPTDSQFDVFFTSVPENHAVENEAVFVFRTYDRFHIRSFHDLVGMLPESQESEVRAGVPTAATIDTVCRRIGSRRFLLVTVREEDVLDSVYFYRLEARVFRQGAAGAGAVLPDETFRVLSFCRDRRSRSDAIALTNVLLLLLAVGAVLADTRFRGGASRPRSLLVAALALTAFGVGRLLPWALFYALSPLVPAPDTLAVLSFWWMCLAGVALVIVPPVVFAILAARLEAAVPFMRLAPGRGGAVGIALGLGASAYLAGPVLLYVESGAVSVLIPIVAAIAMTAFLLGSGMDREDDVSHWAAAPALVLSLAMGCAIGHLNATWLWAVLALAAVAVAVALRFEALSTEWIERALTERKRTPGLPTTVAALQQACSEPGYRTISAAYDEGWEALAPAAEDRTAWLFLTGERGVGKTATANALVGRLQSELSGQSRRTIVLKGECLNSIGPRKPFTAFHQALGKHLGGDLTGLEDSGTRMDTALLGIVDSLVPIAGLLLPSPGEAPEQQRSQDEIFESVASSISRLARKHVVVLFIEDVQWIDDASRDLLRYLFRSFPRGGKASVSIVLTAQTSRDIERLGVSTGLVNVTLPDETAKARLLVESLDIRRDVAQRIVTEAGKGGASGGELLWLLEVVSHLAEIGALVHGPDGFTWTEAFHDADELPLPESFDESVEADLRRNPMYRHVLECAACIGLRFTVSVLSRGLDMPRLELLRHLEDIQDQTGLVYDVRTEDDVFSFRSSLVLETIRNGAKITGHGPASSDVPQLVREYHARIAAAFEADMEAATDRVFLAARQWYAAGASHAEKGYELCLRASRAALSMHRYDEARQFLTMATECGHALRRDESLSDRYAEIDAAEAAARGDGRS